MDVGCWVGLMCFSFAWHGRFFVFFCVGGFGEKAPLELPNPKPAIRKRLKYYSYEKSTRNVDTSSGQ